MTTGRVTLAALAWLALAAMLGCGGSRARQVNSLDGIDAGQRVRIEGRLSLRGSTPMTTAVLEVDSTETVALDSKSPELLSQLKRLSEMRCALEGTTLAFVDQNIPRLSVTSYELLALPDGKMPILGIVTIENECVYVFAEQKRRYWIHGELGAVLREYEGALVWVVGDVFDTDHLGPCPPKSTPLTVTGYGVVDEGPAR